MTLHDQTNMDDCESLRTRLAQALGQASATSEILDVINQSRDDELPVFRAILDRAEKLCHAQGSGLLLLNEAGTHLGMLASKGQDRGSFPLGTQFDLAGPVGQCVAVRERRVVHLEDLKDTELYRQGHEGRRKLVDVEGIRTHLHVPLMRGETAFGSITLSRREPDPFSADEIALVETFAAQAVIAIENARQFRDLQNRLAREAATGEVLSVISQSRDNELPVFETILENAQSLCNAPMSGLVLASKGDKVQTLAAHRGLTEGMPAMFAEGKMVMDGALSYAAKSIIDGELIQFADMGESALYKAGSPIVHSMVDNVGIRSVLFVPLMLNGAAIGCITLFRFEVKPFEDRLVNLVETFAAQAVIAIENVRQFRELQIRLEREQASRDVLQVISQSREDERPVFDVILENAARLCKSAYAGLTLVNDARSHLVYTASHGPDLAYSQYDQMQWDLNGPSSFAEAIVRKRAVRIDDLADTDLYRSGDAQRVAHVDQDGIRSFMAIPLIRDGEAIGAFGLARWEVQPFTQSDMELVVGFAAQAVIAIESTRQFKALETLNAELGARVEAQVGEIKRMARLKRFLPAAVADSVVSTGSEDILKSHRALLGVLFCDIRGFTAFCETAEPEETIEVLQTYHEEMGALIAAHGAGVDTRAGDGIMVLFNDPLPCNDPAGDALRLALAMRARMQELCKGWKRLGHKLGFGVGISLGYATVGMVGSEERYDYTASGTAVNLAARLCDQAKDGDILLSPRAYAAVGDDCTAEPIGEVSLKGIHAPVEVFRVSIEP